MFRPRYTITNKILRSVGEIEAAREVIEDIQLTSDWETKFRLDALIRTVHFGIAMEGNDLTLNQTEKIIKEDPGRDESAEEVARRTGVVARERDVQEAINYRNVIRFVDQLSRLGRKMPAYHGSRGYPFGEKELLQIHSLTTEKIIPSHQLGVYRSMPIKSEGKNGLIAHPPLPVEVPYQMEDFFRWLADVGPNEMHPVIKAAIAQYELTRIAPFMMGNERAVQAFTQLILSAEGYDFRQFADYCEYFDKNLSDYEAARESVERNNGDLTNFVEFFTEGLAQELSRLKERIKRLSTDMALKAKQTKAVALTERQLALMEAIEMKEEMTMTEARSVLPMVSDDTILRDLASLVTKKLIKKKGKTKGARYILRR